MGRIKISALGQLMEKIPSETEINITKELSAFELVEEHFNIPKSESRMAFIINSRMEKGSYVIKPGDSIKVLKMGGAG